MNENSPVDPQEVLRQIGDVDQKAKTTPRYGPGWLGMALPNIGHAPSCEAREFDSAKELNLWAQEMTENARSPLIYSIMTKADKILVVWTTVKSEETVDEMRRMSVWVDEKLQEFKAKREEEKQAAEKAKNESAQRDAGLQIIGRKCVELHGIAHDLPAMTIVKNVRKSLADDILKLFISAVPEENKDKAVDKLNKILKEYVKDGAK